MQSRPQYKVARRLGGSVFSKTETPKFELRAERKRANQKRGTHRRGNRSEYGAQLLEKQKVRFTYGIHERQFATYVKKANQAKGVPTETLFKLLESRLDNVVYKLGLAKTRPFARQMVTHGHIRVNGRKLNVPSHTVKKGDVISVREGSANNKIFDSLDPKEMTKIPSWVSLDVKKLEGKVLEEPGTGEEALSLNLKAVLEYYSRV